MEVLANNYELVHSTDMFPVGTSRVKVDPFDIQIMKNRNPKMRRLFDWRIENTRRSIFILGNVFYHYSSAHDLVLWTQTKRVLLWIIFPDDNSRKFKSARTGSFTVVCQHFNRLVSPIHWLWFLSRENMNQTVFIVLIFILPMDEFSSDISVADTLKNESLTAYLISSIFRAVDHQYSICIVLEWYTIFFLYGTDLQCCLRLIKIYPLPARDLGANTAQTF